MTSRKALLVGLVGLSIATGLTIKVLSGADWDATILVAFGEEATPTREYAEERLGDVWLRTVQGHDGKFFFVQANDPWLFEPETNAAILDRPRYRSQRMLYPALAGVGGLLSPAQIVWGLILVNVIAIGIGSLIVAELALHLGASAWWGLAFALNLGVVGELAISGAGVLGALFAFLGVLWLERGSPLPAIASFALAGLSREVMLLAALGSAFLLWRRSERRLAALVAILPAVVVGLWGLYVQQRVEPGSGGAPVFDWPFLGIARSFDYWRVSPLDLLAGFAMMLLLILFLRRAALSSNFVGWAFLGFVPLGFLLSEYVWRSWFDISRAIAPVLTAYVLLLFARRVAHEVEIP